MSTNPIDSDIYTNQVIVNNLIGTLVKYGNTGQYEPFLAETWEISEDGKKWKFKIRKNLFCEDNTPITPELYKISLQNILRNYLNYSDIMEFEKLRGWKDFVKGKNEIDGLIAKDDFLEFNFLSKPDSLLEFLRMPYFGFYSQNNFNEDGSWKDSKKIISSGSYKIDEINQEYVKLSLRENWFTATDESFKNLVFKSQNLINALENTNKTIIYIENNNSELDQNFTLVKGLPTILNSMILSIDDKSIFNSKNARKWFLNEIRRAQSNSNFNINSCVSTNTFYSTDNQTSAIHTEETHSVPFSVKEITYFIPKSFSVQEVLYTENILRLISKKSNLIFSRVQLDNVDLETRKKLRQGKIADIRLAGVFVGGKVYNSTIKMIFCTNLGVEYPDPSERICKLVSSTDNHGIDNEQDYLDTFNSILIDDAAVLPLYHMQPQWLYSKDFKKSSIPIDPTYPRFELLR